VALRDGRLHIAPVKAATSPEAEALADAIDGMLPPVRITELLHEVSRRTGFSAAFTNLRTGETCDSENALLAAILADATNLGLTRMAAASPGVTRDQLIWIADAYIRPETYQAALAGIINAHHALPSPRSGATEQPPRPTGNSLLGGHDAAVWLFGSCARGEVRQHSEIDIAILPHGELRPGFFGELEAGIEESTIPYDVDLVDLRHADPALVAEVRCEGVKWRD